MGLASTALEIRSLAGPPLGSSFPMTTTVPGSMVPGQGDETQTPSF
jgi:hypothetical protein